MLHWVTQGLKAEKKNTLTGVVLSDSAKLAETTEANCFSLIWEDNHNVAKQKERENAAESPQINTQQQKPC